MVEGPHDVEFVARILRPYGLDRIGVKADLDVFWHGLVPNSFPSDGQDLLKRVPVPIFFQHSTHSVAIRSAGGGDARLAQAVQEGLSVLDPTKLVGVGLILDADRQMTPAARFSAVKTEIVSLSRSKFHGRGGAGATIS